MYMNCGGRQWLEGVDLKLAFEVIKYCMDSPIEGKEQAKDLLILELQERSWSSCPVTTTS